MKDWCHTNNVLQVHCWGCLVVQVMFRAQSRSQSRSNCGIDISPSIFELEHRSKAKNVGNAYGYLSGILNFRCNFR